MTSLSPVPGRGTGGARGPRRGRRPPAGRLARSARCRPCWRRPPCSVSRDLDHAPVDRSGPAAPGSSAARRRRRTMTNPPMIAPHHRLRLGRGQRRGPAAQDRHVSLPAWCGRGAGPATMTSAWSMVVLQLLERRGVVHRLGQRVVDHLRLLADRVRQQQDRHDQGDDDQHDDDRDACSRSAQPVVDGARGRQSGSRLSPPFRSAGTSRIAVGHQELHEGLRRRPGCGA